MLRCLSVGLGNYINTINREVNNLATRTRESVENVNQQVVELTADMKSIEDDVLDLKLNKNVASDRTSEDFIASSLRTDVAGRFHTIRILPRVVLILETNESCRLSGLSTKLYTLKTSVFEMSGELTSLKSGLESLNTEVDTVDQNVKALSEDVKSSEKEDATIKSELGAVKSGLSGLSNSVLTMKSRLSSLERVEGRVRELGRNLTGVRDDLTSSRTQLAQLSPEVSLIATDISALRAGISRMSVTVSSMADPPRFSCGVTGEEVKVSGVIAYDECAVNTEKMMNLGTGHATVPVSGDYLLTFSANMVRKRVFMRSAASCSCSGEQ